jgi:hypothetical protein
VESYLPILIGAIQAILIVQILLLGVAALQQ